MHCHFDIYSKSIIPIHGVYNVIMLSYTCPRRNAYLTSATTNISSCSFKSMLYIPKIIVTQLFFKSLFNYFIHRHFIGIFFKA